MKPFNFKLTTQLMKAATGYNNTPKVEKSVYDTLVKVENAPVEFVRSGQGRVPQLTREAHRLVRGVAVKAKSAPTRWSANQLLRVSAAIRRSAGVTSSKGATPTKAQRAQPSPAAQLVAKDTITLTGMIEGELLHFPNLTSQVRYHDALAVALHKAVCEVPGALNVSGDYNAMQITAFKGGYAYSFQIEVSKDADRKAIEEAIMAGIVTPPLPPGREETKINLMLSPMNSNHEVLVPAVEVR